MAKLSSIICSVLIVVYFNQCTVTVLAAIGIENLNRFSKSHVTVGKDAFQDNRVRELANSISTVERIADFIEENKDSLSQEMKNQNIELPELPENVKACWRSLNSLYDGIANKELWAYSFLDAMGKPESGMLEGSLSWQGSYELCKSIEVPETMNPIFGTKTCVSFISLPLGKEDTALHRNDDDRSTIFQPDPSILILHGICIPDTCSAAAAWIWTNELVSEFENVTHFPVCEEEYSLEPGGIGFICVAAVFLILIVTGTIYDIYVYQPSLKKTSANFPSNLTNVSSFSAGDSRNDVSGRVRKEFKTSPDWSESKTSTDKKNGMLPSGGPINQNGQVNEVPHANVASRTPKCVDPMVSKESLTADKKNKKNLADIFLRFVLCFSVYTNGGKLLSTKSSGGTLQCVHGIRFFSIFWVILGHTYSTAMIAIDNRMAFFQLPKEFFFHTIYNGTFSVDTFFLLSGLLVTYLFLKEKSVDRKVTPGTMLYFYIHRFWRLTPVYMLCLWFFTFFYPLLGEGTFWFPEFMGVSICKDEWWKNLLYIGNLWDTDEHPLCFGHSWYLSNDMQMYWITPLILLPLIFGWVYIAIGGIILLIVTHISSTIAICLKHDLSAFSNSWLIYVKPWSRIGVYAVGMALGYILHKTKPKIKLQKWLLVCGWILAGFFCLAPLYASYPYNKDLLNGIEQPWPRAKGLFYESCSRISWGVGVAIIIFICISGYGGIVNTLLSWKALIPLARLSYCAYLIHPAIQGAFFQSRHRPIYIDHSTMVMYFFGSMVMTFMVSAVISLAFEAPMIALEKFVLGKNKKSKSADLILTKL